MLRSNHVDKTQKVKRITVGRRKGTTTSLTANFLESWRLSFSQQPGAGRRSPNFTGGSGRRKETVSRGGERGEELGARAHEQASSARLFNAVRAISFARRAGGSRVKGKMSGRSIAKGISRELHWRRITNITLNGSCIGGERLDEINES